MTTQHFLFAFLGGLILNVMPCVLPVLTLKVFHTIEQGEQSHAERRMHGIAYGAGTLIAFLVFASVLVAIRAAGDHLAWGMQFQHPEFVAVLTIILVIFGLNALGVFDISLSAQGKTRSGLLGSVMNGVFAAVMATPCSAPFLGTAAAVALGAEAQWWETYLLLAAIGAGLASPFVLISFVPRLAAMLPRPGVWMETFKHVMGFTLLAAAVWLFGVLQSQVTPESANWFLGFLLLIGIALWYIDRFGSFTVSVGRRWAVRAGVLVVVSIAATQMVSFEPMSKSVAVEPQPVAAGEDYPILKDNRINWLAFSPDRVAAENKKNRIVFIDYTADWCINCKTQDKLVLETEPVRQALVRTKILPMKADFTNEDETIEKWLAKIGLSAIPAYALYQPDGTIDVLPTTITKELVISRLEASAKKFPQN